MTDRDNGVDIYGEGPGPISKSSLALLMIGAVGVGAEVQACYEEGQRGNWPGIGLIVAALVGAIGKEVYVGWRASRRAGNREIDSDNFE